MFSMVSRVGKINFKTIRVHGRNYQWSWIITGGLEKKFDPRKRYSATAVFTLSAAQCCF